MVNATDIRSRASVLLLAGLVLTAAAWLRSAEYDEQYTLFLTGGTARPVWPAAVFEAGVIPAAQAGHAALANIVRDLRTTDVHPPLYFWLVAQWRSVAGPGLFAARLLSVLLGLGSIALVGNIARRSAIRPTVAMLLTLGCYGFAYTSSIARGFAFAELLVLSGVALLLSRRPLLAGVCLGAACCCNYLAVFAAAGVIIAGGAWLAIPAAIPFLALDGWFFMAQHAARPGQFPPFELWPSLLRLAQYQLASVFGGLPLYADGPWRPAIAGGLGVVGAGLVVCLARHRPWHTHRLLLAGVLAPPAGLLLLGAVFDNTPIELRYLSFGLPFLALLLARLNRRILTVVLAIQSAGIAGLMLSPQTMQPARAAALAAMALPAGTIVLVPAGNDGVGIVGAFGIEAPSRLPVLLIRADDRIVAHVARYDRVALAALAQDHDSAAAIVTAHAALTRPDWHLIGQTARLEVYERGDDRSEPLAQGGDSGAQSQDRSNN